MIDDPDDARVGRDLDRVERKAGFLAAHEKHALANARADGIHGNERPTEVLPVRGDGLKHEELDASEILVLARADDIAEDPGELHQSPAVTSTVSTMPTIAASTGQSFMPDAMRAELPD